MEIKPFCLGKLDMEFMEMYESLARRLTYEEFGIPASMLGELQDKIGRGGNLRDTKIQRFGKGGNYEYCRTRTTAASD